jgi:hypothetical protein
MKIIPDHWVLNPNEGMMLIINCVPQVVGLTLNAFPETVFRYCGDQRYIVEIWQFFKSGFDFFKVRIPLGSDGEYRQQRE